MEEGERADGDVLKHGPAYLWGTESLGAHGRMSEREGLVVIH